MEFSGKIAVFCYSVMFSGRGIVNIKIHKVLIKVLTSKSAKLLRMTNAADFSNFVCKLSSNLSNDDSL